MRPAEDEPKARVAFQAPSSGSEARAFLQERLGVLGRVYALLAVAFLVAENVALALLARSWTAPGVDLGSRLVLGTAAVASAQWWVCRGGPRTEAAAARRGRGHDHARRPAQRRARLRGVSRRAPRVVARARAAAASPWAWCCGRSSCRARLGARSCSACAASGLAVATSVWAHAGRGTDPTAQAVHARLDGARVPRSRGDLDRRVALDLRPARAGARGVAARAVHAAREDRRGRDGRRLPRQPCDAAAAHRGQAAPARPGRRRPAAALRARGADDEPAHAPQHRRDLRLRPHAGRRLLLRDGVPRGAEPRGPRRATTARRAPGAWCTCCGRWPRPWPKPTRSA